MKDKFTIRPTMLWRGIIAVCFGTLAVLSGVVAYFTDKRAFLLCAFFTISTILRLFTMLRPRVIVDGDTITKIPSFGKKTKFTVRDVLGVHIYDREVRKSYPSGGILPVVPSTNTKNKTIFVSFANGNNMQVLYHSKNAPLLVDRLRSLGVTITEKITESE